MGWRSSRRFASQFKTDIAVGPSHRGDGDGLISELNRQKAIFWPLSKLRAHVRTLGLSDDWVEVIVKPGMDSQQVIARFDAERQALAMMEHPNIARIIDAGTTELGRPYFVMELVRGIPINEFCENQRGQTSLMPFLGRGLTLGRPLGLIVDSKSSRRAMDSTQPSSPKGAPRWAQLRIALSS